MLHKDPACLCLVSISTRPCYIQLSRWRISQNTRSPISNPSGFKTLPYPTQSFEGLTILVTGGNSGLGLEAARHFVRLHAAKVLLAVRDIEKGTGAAQSIGKTTGRPNVIEMWELDLTSYDSVLAFASRVDQTLDRLDIVVENAGVSSHTFQRAEDNELMVTVNFVSTILLGLLLLPKLRRTSMDYDKQVVLTFVGSFLHCIAKFPEGTLDDILGRLADESVADMHDRYNSVKLMLLFAVREMASRLSRSDKGGRIITSVINPGSVKTNMGSNNGFMFDVLRKVLFRETEHGSRTLVHGAQGGTETHGQYLNDCTIGTPSHFVRSDSGARVQKAVWDQVLERLERIHPGIQGNV